MLDSFLFDVFVLSICCLTLLTNLYFIYWHKRILLFPLANIFIILSNFIGIPFIKFLDENLSVLKDQYLNERATCVMVIYSLIITSILLFLYPLLISNKPIEKDKALRKNACFFVILIFSICSFLNFFIVSKGYQYVGSIFSFGTDFYNYYINRILLGKEILDLHGATVAFLLTSYINPVLMSILILEAKKRKKFTLKNKVIFLYLAASLFLISIVFSKRFSLIFSLVFPFVLIIYLRVNLRHNKSFKPTFFSFIIHLRKLILNKFSISMFILLIVFFSMFSGNGLIQSSFDVLTRTVAIPAATNNYYYYTFPEVYNFRGIDKIAKMGTDGSNVDVSYQDIGEITTGQRFVPNANFLTISYSGGEYFGVALISIIYSTMCLVHDFFISRVDIDFSNICLISNIYGLYALTATPFQVSIFSYGFILSTIFIFTSIKFVKYKKIKYFE